MSEFGIFWGDELFSKCEKKVPIINQFLYEKDIMCIKAKEGIGKTQLVLQIICYLISTENMFGVYEVKKKCNVLYIQSEGDRADTLERFEKFTNALDVTTEMFSQRLVHMNIEGIELDTKSGMETLIEQAKKPGIKYDVIVIDPLYMTLSDTVNSEKPSAQWCKNVRRFKDMYNAAMIVVHHEPKDQFYKGKPIQNKRVIGSYVWGGFFNSYYTLSYDEGQELFWLKNNKQRSGQLFEHISFKMIDKGDVLFFSAELEDINISEIKIRKILKVNGKMHWKEIATVSGFGRNSVFSTLKRLHDNNEIDKDGHGYYWYVI